MLPPEELTYLPQGERQENEQRYLEGMYPYVNINRDRPSRPYSIPTSAGD